MLTKIRKNFVFVVIGVLIEMICYDLSIVFDICIIIVAAAKCLDEKR